MKRTVLVLIVLSLSFFTGCFGVSDYFTAVKNDILNHVDGDFSYDTEFAIGPVLISVAEMFIDSDEDPEAAQILSDVSKVQLSVYKRIGSSEKGSNYDAMRSIDRRMRKYGMRYIVKTCGREEMSVIYVNRNLDRGIRKMFIVSLDKEELVLIQLDGNLSRVFETAIRDRGLDHSYVSR